MGVDRLTLGGAMGLGYRELSIDALAPGAVSLLLSDRTPEALQSLEVVLGSDRARPVDRALVLSAWRSESLIGAALAIRQPGSIAMVWPPRTMPSEPQASMSALLRELLLRLHDTGVQLAQAFPDTPQSTDQALLTEAGFEHAAD